MTGMHGVKVAVFLKTDLMKGQLVNEIVFAVHILRFYHCYAVFIRALLFPPRSRMLFCAW